MEYSVLAQTQQIDFAPATELAEILQNIRTIISTPKYSVPLDRDFGVSMSWLDNPMPVAQARLTAEIITEIQKREPRARVTQVTYTESSHEGILIPNVKVRVADELA
jgi:phage baseplate assembly protein W